MPDARFRKLYPRLWHHAAFLALSDAAKVVALYLLTGPQTNRIGYYRLSSALAQEDLGMTRNAWDAALSAVLTAFDWSHDAEARVILIASWWKWNGVDNPKHMAGCLSDLADVPVSPLFAQFCEQARAAIPEGIRYQFDTYVQGYAIPSRDGMANGIGNGMPYRMPYQETRQDGDGDQTETPSGGSVPFEEFWSRYPRKVSKRAAEKAWLALSPNRDLADAILAALARHVTLEQWRKDGGAFVPHAATWLRGRRWEDVLDAPSPPQGETHPDGWTKPCVQCGAAFTPWKRADGSYAVVLTCPACQQAARERVA